VNGGIIAQVANTINSYQGWQCELSEHNDFDILLRDAPVEKVRMYGRRLAVEFPRPAEGFASAVWLLPTAMTRNGYQNSRLVQGVADTVLIMTQEVTWFIKHEQLANLLLAKQTVADPEMAVLMGTTRNMGQGVYGVAVPQGDIETIAINAKETRELIDGT
jgi:hypothetical protein